MQIYRAKKIITMNPVRPAASHVAVRDGRILGVGSLEELKAWQLHDNGGAGSSTTRPTREVDERFADKILMPGFVEGHSHLIEGVLWRFVYCGFFDRMDPQGKVWPGLKNIEGVIARLREHAKKSPDEQCIGWGFDPIYFEGARCTRADLDQVTRGLRSASGGAVAVGVWHARQPF